MLVLTKSRQIEHFLKNAIISGRWTPGERLPAERELLSELGVSRTTLRDALNGLAKDGLIVRSHGSGTYVSTQKTDQHIVILGETKQLSSKIGYWYNSLVNEAQRSIEASGYRTVLSIGHGDSEEQFISSTNFNDISFLRNTLGVLCLTNPGILLDRFDQAGILYTTIRSGNPDGRSSVVLDYKRMTSMAANELHSHGYHDFAVMYVNRKPEMAGLERMYQEQKRLINSIVDSNQDRLVPVEWSLNIENAYDVFKEWWRGPNRTNAIFFYDDSLCSVATRAILALGIRVPEELAILTHANVGRTFQFPVELTSIGFDASEVVSTAWSMMQDTIKGIDFSDPIRYISPVIQNGSSLGE